MSTGASGLAELVPLALIIAFSPLSIIPGILMLHTPRPRPTSSAFLLGWLIAIFVITGASVALSDAAGSDLDKAPGWSPYVRIVIGAALIAFGLYRWFTRHRVEHSPKWLTSMTSATPPRAFLTAVVLTVANAKVLIMCIAAGAAIGTAALGTVGTWRAVGLFTVLAGSSVAVLVIGYLLAGERLDHTLERVRAWMERNHSALIAVILVLIGAGLLYKGIHAL